MEPYMYSMFRMKYKNFKKKFQLGVFRGGGRSAPPGPCEHIKYAGTNRVKEKYIIFDPLYVPGEG